MAEFRIYGYAHYSAEKARQASKVLRALGTPLLIHQPRYSMLDRWVEAGLLDVLEHEGIGSIVFSPLAQGQLTDRYLEGIPSGARAAKTERVWLTPDTVNKNLPKVRKFQIAYRP